MSSYRTRTFVIEDTSVRIEKVVHAEGAQCRVEYLLKSTADSSVTVRCVEKLPEEPPDITLRTNSLKDELWHRLGASLYGFTTALEPGQQLQTALSLEKIRLESEILTSEPSLTVIESDAETVDETSDFSSSPPEKYHRENIEEETIEIDRSRIRINGSEDNSITWTTGIKESLPAFGIITANTGGSTLARTIARAQDYGFQVFVTTTGDLDQEVIQLVENLGATVLHPIVPQPTQRMATQRLALAAAKESHPGVIICTDPDNPVDFETSETEFKNQEDRIIPVATDSQTSKTVVGIPAYNEAKSIGDIIRQIKNFTDEVLVVDDGSTDSTTAQAQDAGATVIEHESNQGYGAALKTILREANRRNADHLVLIDADGQHDPADIPKLLEAQRSSSADIVIGSRFTEDGKTDAPLYRQFGLSVVNFLTNFSLGLIRSESRLRDTQSGFRVYSATAVQTLLQTGSIGDDMDASTDILYKAHESGLEIDEIGTTINYDVESESSHNPVHHGIILCRNLVKKIKRDRPMTVFGAPGVIFMFTGVALGYWTMLNYLISSSSLLGFTLMTVLFILFGVLSFLTGIIQRAINIQLRNET